LVTALQQGYAKIGLMPIVKCSGKYPSPHSSMEPAEMMPESVSVRPCVSFFVRDRSIKVHFIGRLRARRMACGRMPRRAAGESYFQKKTAAMIP
jgi:hypothetical protein